MKTSISESRAPERSPVSSPVTDVLREAKGRVTKAWWQEDGPGAGEKEESTCIVLACGHASYDLGFGSSGPEFEGARDALAKAAGLPKGQKSTAPLYRWNDTHTHAEVIDLFDRALMEVSA